MKFDILEEKDNRLLNRKQYKVKITDSNVTPKREDVLKSFCSKQGLDDKKFIIETLETTAGKREVIGNFKYYDSEKDLKRIEVESNVKAWKKVNGIEDTAKEKKAAELAEAKKKAVKKK